MLARVPEDRVAAKALLHREIALEHASACAEFLDAHFEVWPPCSCDLFRCKRRCCGLAYRLRTPHRQRAKLHKHVRMRCECGHTGAPFGKHLVSAACVGTAEDRAAEMVQHYRRLRKTRRQIRHFAQLRMINPSIEGEAEFGEVPVTLSEIWLREELRTRHGFMHALIGVPCGGKSNRAKTSAADANVRREDPLDACAQQQIHIADHSGACA